RRRQPWAAADQGRGPADGCAHADAGDLRPVVDPDRRARCRSAAIGRPGAAPGVRHGRRAAGGRIGRDRTARFRARDRRRALSLRRQVRVQPGARAGSAARPRGRSNGDRPGVRRPPGQSQRRPPWRRLAGDRARLARPVEGTAPPPGHRLVHHRRSQLGGRDRSGHRRAMKAEALKVPIEGGDKWRLRLTATAAALVLGFGIYMLQRMPAAETLSAPDDQLSATSTQALALYNIRAAPVMQYDGAVDAGLRISVSTGRLAPATRRNLFALKIPVPNVKGAPIQWQARPPKGGRISVRIGNQRQDPVAGMMLQATGSGQVVELNIRAVETNLTAQIDIAAGGSAEAAAPEFRFGN